MEQINTVLAKSCAELKETSECKPTQPTQLSTANKALLQTFPTIHALTAYFGIDHLTDYTDQRYYLWCFFGKNPTMVDIKMTYGQKAAEGILYNYLACCVEYIGGNDKMAPEEIGELAKRIYDKVYYLKITEVMLYCRRLTDCDYFTPNGALRPAHFMRCLHDFIDERNREIDKMIAKLREKQREEQARRACTYEEHLALMKAAQENKEK